MTYNSRYLLVLLFSIIIFTGCKKDWDKRVGVADQQLDTDLLQQIQANSNLSTFAGYLTATGFDKVLASSKTYTVWAPTNDALQGLDQAIVADPEKLKDFVSNHIANQAYLTSSLFDSPRVRMLSGKKVTATPSTIDDASISVSNLYLKNGVLHTINKPLVVRMNIDEYIRSISTDALLHKAYILGQDTSFIDTSKATIISYDSQGKPVLEPGTGVVNQNLYYTRTRDLANEDSLFTYIVFTDAAYNTERTKLAPYFQTVTNSTDSTMNILAAYHVLKDAVISGAVFPANLQGSLMSIDKVPVPVTNGAVVRSYQASNGMVYVLNSVNFNVADKIRPIFIQGEAPSFFSRTDFPNNIAYRSRRDPSNKLFTDIFVGGANLPAQSFAAYTISGLYTTKYRVVRRSLNDVAFTTPTNISPRVLFGQTHRVTTSPNGTLTPETVVNFPFTAITPGYTETPAGSGIYNEVLLTGATAGTARADNTIAMLDGTLNVLKYKPINMYFWGANSGTANVNAITFDYIKLEPILK